MPDEPADPLSSPASPAPASGRRWRAIARGTAGVGVAVVGWACLTGWGAVVHGHPLYAILLGATLLGCLLVVLTGRRSVRSRSGGEGRRLIARVVVLALCLGWLAALAWLRPFSAVEPALTALSPGSGVAISEDAMQIVLSPVAPADRTGVFFQPGARVDARAYAAVLRPLAESGHLVVIAKQPLGIAFLAGDAFAAARRDHPTITRWVVAGHSLGGTVAALQADAADTDPVAPAVGLLLFASYPAGDISDSLRARVLSVSASRDGLATPDKIAASRSSLPAGTAFQPIDGAVHAFFGDYGPQPGDGVPTISHDEARAQIARAAVDFVTSLDA